MPSSLKDRALWMQLWKEKIVLNNKLGVIELHFCTKCKTNKPIDQFNGVLNWCLECKSKNNKKFMKENNYENKIQRIFSTLKRHVNSRKNRQSCEFLFTEKEFIRWYFEEDNKQECYYCKRSKEECLKDFNGYYTRLTFDRKDNTLREYSIKNCCLCCFHCNSVKGDYITEKMMLLIGPELGVRQNARNLLQIIEKPPIKEI
jgi:hypothetical protein